jgi:enamine deaminase RidA (YjgF/YER057c/UK114 family)
MPRQVITTANAPTSALYSQGVKAGPHVLVSGIVGIDPSTGSLAGDTIQDQTRQALTNCEAILQAGGASLDDVIEVGILLTKPADFAGWRTASSAAAWPRTTARTRPGSGRSPPGPATTRPCRRSGCPGSEASGGVDAGPAVDRGYRGSPHPHSAHTGDALPVHNRGRLGRA